MYTFYEDPGHGWLAVKQVELIELGIAEEITGYSYQSRDGHTVYLEEDCDLSTFVKARGWKSGCNWAELIGGVDHIHHNDDSFIRALPHYQPLPVRISAV